MHAVRVILDGGVFSSFSCKVARAIAPNVHFIQATVQAPVKLLRGRTWFEFVQVLLGWVRVWLFWVAYLFFWGATLLRLGGNGLSALGGLFAFTVVVSVALSILSALVFLSASGADAVGSVIIYLAKFTETAKERSVSAREFGLSGQDGHEAISKLGPRALPPKSFEQLEDFLTQQLAKSPVQQSQRQASGFATPIHALRSRPDIPRLSHDPLLVRCYDLQLIDASGSIFPDIGPEEVMDLFDRAGFFAYSSKAVKKVAAVMLLRLLAWRRVVGIVSPPPTPGAETEEALRYVFVSGLVGGGAGAVYQFLTGMPVDFKMAGHKSRTELRPIMHHNAAYAVLACPRLDGEQTQGKAHWVTNLSHGIVSCLIFGLTTDALGRFASAAASPETSTAPPQLPPAHPPEGAASTVPQQQPDVAVGVGGGEQGRPEQQQQQQQQQSREALQGELSQVWQALELHRPVLLLVQQGRVKSGQDMDVDVQVEDVREVSSRWTALLTEEANRRGLDSNLLTVAPAVLSDQPPMGASGFGQIKNWVSHALSNARSST